MTILAGDPDPRTTEALANATGDKSWIIRAAALEALAKRADPSVLNTVELYLSDQEGEVKYTAAATALRLMAIRQARAVGKDKEGHVFSPGGNDRQKGTEVIRQEKGA